MMYLSDTPLMSWSRPPSSAPKPFRDVLALVGYHEAEIEQVAEDMLAEHGDWISAVEDLF